MARQVGDENNAGPSTDRFANRRQERMRGAGKHEITSRKTINFDNLNSTPSTIVNGGGSGEERRSSIAALLSSSVSRANARESVPSTPLFFGGGRKGGDVSSSPAMSIRSGRGVGSSPSKYIDPRLLGDDTHQQYLNEIDRQGGYNHSSSPMVNGRLLVGKTIEERRQERMRGAGVHQIESRPVRFSIGDSTGGDSSSSAGQKPQRVEAIYTGTPWKSPAGSLDRFMHSFANGEGNGVDAFRSDWMEQRRAERRRGAGTHAIESRKISFGPRGTDGSTTASSIAGLDEDEAEGVHWIEQRREERRRGAGTHAMEQRKIAFGPRATDGSMTASSIADLEEQNERAESDWIEQRREERRRGAGNHSIEQRKISFGLRGTDGSITASSIASPNESFRGAEATHDFVNGSRFEHNEECGFDLADDQHNDGSADVDSMQQAPGSVAATRAMEKRKRKRQSSPPRKKSSISKSKKSMPTRTIDVEAINEEADETVMAQGDLTLQEQRETAFIASTPPSWTFPKAPVTNEDLVNMKEQVQEMVTLALGDDSGKRKSIKVNDADVLYSIIKKEIGRARQQIESSSEVIKVFLDTLMDSLLNTFTHLSRQSAERCQLILYLVTTRRKNLQLRKEVFQRRSQVLKVMRTMQALKEQEMKRVQREEDEEKSLAFLKRLEEHSHEWLG